MRKVADCREMPSESECSLMISGNEDEVVQAASQHAAAAHGHEDNPEMREQIRGFLQDEGAAGRYGTVMIANLTGSADDLQRAGEDWARERRVPGFLGDETLVSDDGRTVVVTVFFKSREDYQRLADDPEQDRWWNERFAPHLSDVRWIDGSYQASIPRQAPRRAQPA